MNGRLAGESFRIFDPVTWVQIVSRFNAEGIESPAGGIFIKVKIMAWKKKKKHVAELLFVGGLFIGLGIGMIYNQVAAGVLIGMGCGFIASFIARVLMKQK